MFKLLLTLHLLFAIFLIGPLTMIPMTAMRSIRHRNAANLQSAARQTMIYGLASILVFLIGFGLVAVRPDRFSLAAPWLTISMTLYIVALLVVFLVLIPGLRKSAKLIERGVPDTKQLTAPTAEATAGKSVEEQPSEPALAPTASDLATKQKLDALYGRTAGSAGLVTLLFIAIVVLMVVQPFS
jgi:uncharacterized membrane protein